MALVEIEVLSQETNAWVVQTPGRQFPAAVVQGDSLSILFNRAQSVLERARTCECPDDELVQEAEELRDLLWARVQHYEATLRAHGITLPYDRTRWPE